MSGKSLASPTFLGLEDLHVFITGAAGGIGKQAVREFLGTLALTHVTLRCSIGYTDLFLYLGRTPAHGGP